MISLVVGSFLIGFLGSMHCVGMCGGLVTTLSMTGPSIWWSGLASYQVGRIASYTFLGLLTGIIGLTFTSLAWFSGVQQALAALAGVMMILFGLQIAGWMADPLQRLLQWVVHRIRLQQWLQAVAGRKGVDRWFVAGMLNGFLPCGLVYAGLAFALGAGSIPASMMVMIAFGFGTVPAMMLVPAVMQKATPALRSRFVKMAGVFLIGIGLVTILRGGDWMQSMHRNHNIQHGDVSTPMNPPSDAAYMHMGGS